MVPLNGSTMTPRLYEEMCVRRKVDCKGGVKEEETRGKGEVDTHTSKGGMLLAFS